MRTRTGVPLFIQLLLFMKCDLRVALMILVLQLVIFGPFILFVRIVVQSWRAVEDVFSFRYARSESSTIMSPVHALYLLLLLVAVFDVDHTIIHVL